MVILPLLLIILGKLQSGQDLIWLDGILTWTWLNEWATKYDKGYIMTRRRVSGHRFPCLRSGKRAKVKWSLPGQKEEPS